MMSDIIHTTQKGFLMKISFAILCGKLRFWSSVTQNNRKTKQEMINIDIYKCLGKGTFPFLNKVKHKSLIIILRHSLFNTIKIKTLIIPTSFESAPHTYNIVDEISIFVTNLKTPHTAYGPQHTLNPNIDKMINNFKNPF